MRLRPVLLVCTVALSPLVGGSITAAQDSPAKATYVRYCGACHGADGKGEGMVATFLRPKPTDLTQLAKQNNGDFPFGRMIHVIDGRLTVRAHGDPEMPVWGEMFKAQGGMSLAQEAEVRGKLLLIVEYMSSIQEK